MGAMTWQPEHLTRDQMAERRAEGGRLLQEGQLSQHAIALELGVSDAAVSQWKSRLANGGPAALAPRSASGRPARLTPAQQRKLVRLLQGGALAAGFPTARWTQARVRDVIVREFGVRYHPDYVGTLLHRLGWSVQKPEARAVEREEDLIRAWLTHDWPRIKKSAAARRRHCV
jgi:putative transposase